MKHKLVGYYWDGKNSWIIYQEPCGVRTMKKRKKFDK
jgi:hypothetical protein